MSPARSDSRCLPALGLPEIDDRGADEWDPTYAALIRETGDSDALVEYYKKWCKVRNTIRKHMLHFLEKKEPIAKCDAFDLAKDMKKVCLDAGFSGPEDWRAFLTGQCLTLKPADGPVHGGAFASATVMLLPNPGWRKIQVAFPAELVSAFGVQTCAWLHAHLESRLREFVAHVAGKPYSRGGEFAMVFDHSTRPKPELRSIPLVPAPVEERIAYSARRTQTKIDHWEALVRAGEILRRYRQPFGDALSDWALAVLSEELSKPDGRTLKRSASNKLRNLALNEVVCVLVDCGLPKAGDFPDTRVSACEIAAEAFEIGANRDWNAVSKAIRNLPRGKLFGG